MRAITLSTDDVYGGTFRVMTKVLTPVGISSTFVDTHRLENIEAGDSAKHEGALP